MITAIEIRQRASVAKRIAGELADIERRIKQHADSGWVGPLTITAATWNNGEQTDAIVRVLRDSGYYVNVRRESSSHTSLIVKLEEVRS